MLVCVYGAADVPSYKKLMDALTEHLPEETEILCGLIKGQNTDKIRYIMLTAID